MISKELEVRNKLGLHARAAGALVRVAASFSSQVMVEKDGTKVNAKSIMGLLLLAASQGSLVTVTADGEDEGEALAAVEDLLLRKFDEE